MANVGGLQTSNFDSAARCNDRRPRTATTAAKTVRTGKVVENHRTCWPSVSILGVAVTSGGKSETRINSPKAGDGRSSLKLVQCRGSLTLHCTHAPPNAVGASGFLRCFTQFAYLEGSMREKPRIVATTKDAEEDLCRLVTGVRGLKSRRWNRRCPPLWGGPGGHQPPLEPPRAEFDAFAPLAPSAGRLVDETKRAGCRLLFAGEIPLPASARPDDLLGGCSFHVRSRSRRPRSMRRLCCSGGWFL